MAITAASRTNEKLYQTRQLLQLPVSSSSSARSLQKSLLNAAVFSLQGAYLAFLLEISLFHRLKLNYVESLYQLVPLLEQKGITDLAVRELQRLHSEDEWPAWLFGWYRAALGDDGWRPESDKPVVKGNLIEIVDAGAAKVPVFTPAAVQDVLEKLQVFIADQREHLQEW